MQLSISFPFFAISSSNDFLNPFDVMLNLRKNSWFVEVSTTCTTAHDSNDRRSFFFPSLILIPQIKRPTAITYHNKNNVGLISFLKSCFNNINHKLILHCFTFIAENHVLTLARVCTTQIKIVLSIFYSQVINCVFIWSEYGVKTFMQLEL